MSQPVKVTVLLEQSEFDRFARYCQLRGHKKSTLIARLIREHLAAENFQVQKTLALETRSEKTQYE